MVPPKTKKKLLSAVKRSLISLCEKSSAYLGHHTNDDKSVNFTVVKSNNIGLVHILDSCRPIAGEAVVMQAAFEGNILDLVLWRLAHTYLRRSQIRVPSQLLHELLDPRSRLCGCFWHPCCHISVNFLRHGAILYLGQQLGQSNYCTWKWRFIRKYLHWHEDREVRK